MAEPPIPAAATQRPLSCPSARPDGDGVVIFGVVGGNAEAPRVGYLQRPVAPSPEILALAAPAEPAAVFRFGGKCAEGACRHFAGSRCSLGERLVQLLPAVTDHLVPCSLRPTCRWWHERGAAACHRCPQVVTHSTEPSPALAKAAEPPQAATTPP